MAFPTFFNLSLNFAVGTHDLNHSELQVLFLLTTWSFSIFVCKEYNKSDFYIDHVMISICRVVSWVVGTWCFLWPAYSLDKTLLAFALLHFVLQSQACLLFWVSLDFLLLHSNSLWCQGHHFLVLVLEAVVSLRRTSKLHLFWHQYLDLRFGLLSYWVVCLGNEQRSFSCFWHCIQVLHFGLFGWLWGLLHFF